MPVLSGNFKFGKSSLHLLFMPSIIAYDHFSNVFQRVLIDSEHGVLIDYEGIKNADTIFFDKTWTFLERQIFLHKKIK
jgi:hypothetical protein